VRVTDALLARELPGVRLVNFGHLGDGNLHYNVQAPEGGDAAAFLREQEDRQHAGVRCGGGRSAARSRPNTAWAA
jgi:FAD/FMN-containing dehydrogenase